MAGSSTPCRPQKFRPPRIPFPQRVYAILPHVASFSRLSVPQQYFLRLCGPLAFVCLGLRTSSALAAENLFLRKQLGLYVERKKTKRDSASDCGLDNATVQGMRNRR